PGPSPADQTAPTQPAADVANKSKTNQTATATQTGGSSECYSGCGGNGQEQNIDQSAKTKQNADADAKAKQNAVNANVPVDIAGYGAKGGSSTAARDAGDKGEGA